MNMVIGLFTLENLGPAVQQLTESGIDRSDLSTVATVANIPDQLLGEPEKAAVHGAEIGAATGGVLGAIGSVALSGIPGLEGSVASGLMATVAGGVLGGYLGSLYNTKAETQEATAIDEALANGEVLLIVQTTAEGTESVAALMAQAGGHDIETHAINDDHDSN